MFLLSTLVLSMALGTENFKRLFDRADDKEYVGDGHYVDRSVANWLTVDYRDSQYKKKITLTVNTDWILGETPDKYNMPKLIRKLERRIGDYFHGMYSPDDFSVAGMTVTTDINVCDRQSAADYIKVLQRIGRVKGFSPPSENWIDDEISFCLDGNSNGVKFMIYDLAALLRTRYNETEIWRRELKDIIYKIDSAGDMLRVDVMLAKPKAVRAYTLRNDTTGQIVELLGKTEEIFLDTFIRIVPYGDYYKKDEAVEIIRKRVTDTTLKRKMLRLLGLIPEKKSLHLGMKAMGDRNVRDLLTRFAEIDISPVTISKRQDVKKLESLYGLLASR